jgi:hypothetical protein
MNLDDESYLSAYLDGELDPADRLAVEWSIESSPILAERLRHLAQARDAVDGLDRPAIPRDLAPGLVARISADRRRARLRSLAGPVRSAAAFAAVFAVAACMLVASVLMFRATHETTVADRATPKLPNPNPNPNPNPIRPDVDPAPRTHQSIPSLADAAPSPSPLALIGSDRTLVARPRLEPPAPPGEAQERGDRRLVERMLERPRVRRIVIVTDVIDAADRVKDLIQEDARRTPEYARITICQDIIIDPDHAEAAEVFAVPMDDRVHRSFVERLRGRFPDLVEEGCPSVGLVTQLSEVGRVAVFHGTEAAPLGDPPAEFRPIVANRADPPAPAIVAPEPRRPHRPITRPEPDPVVAKADPIDAENRPDFVGPTDPDRLASGSDGSMTVLVWVTRPPRH